MSYKHYYPFVWENSKLVFDWDAGVLHVEFAENKRHYKKDIPLSTFPIHTFYTIGGLIYYAGIIPGGQAEYKLGTEGIVMDFIPATKPKKREKALIKYQDDREMIYTRFYFNRLRLKAFLDMLEAVDKTISVAQIPEGKRRDQTSILPEREVLLIKENGDVFVEDIPIPLPDRSAIYENLKRVVSFQDAYPMTITYEDGRLNLGGGNFEVFKKEGDQFVPHKRLRLGREDALRMMCVISPLR